MIQIYHVQATSASRKAKFCTNACCIPVDSIFKSKDHAIHTNIASIYINIDISSPPDPIIATNFCFSRLHSPISLFDISMFSYHFFCWFEISLPDGCPTTFTCYVPKIDSYLCASPHWTYPKITPFSCLENSKCNSKMTLQENSLVMPVRRANQCDVRMSH